MSTDPREFEHPIDGTGGTVPPLVDVITGVLAGHQWYDATTDCEDPATGCTGCDVWFGDENAVDDGTFAAHQARAVLAAIEQAGGVEWGVQWPFDVLGARPLETVSRSAAEATAESLAKITPKGNPAPVVVSRITGPWERAE